MTSEYKITLLLSMLFINANPLSAEQQIIGVWQTASTEAGYLHVSIEYCGSTLCGSITRAINLDGEPDPSYKYLGKKMLWDMTGNSRSYWTGGKIWNPNNDKTYHSRMSLNKDTLQVSGCVLFLCRSENWTKVVD